MSPPKCGICLSYASSADGDFFVNTQCGHLYHHSCIFRWINQDQIPSRCPVCRCTIDIGGLVKIHGISPIIQSGDEGSELKYNFKITLLGDSGTGKTSILHSLTHGIFKDSNATRGVDVGFKSLEFAGRKIKLTVWDCAGQDRFRAICPNYIRNSHGVLLVYDITDPSSFKNVEEWLRVIYESAPPEVSILMVGNKTDLEDSRKVATDKGLSTAKSLGFEFMEISAKSQTNLDVAFRVLLGKIVSSLWEDGYIDSVEIAPSIVKLSSNEASSSQTSQNSQCRC